MSKRWLWYVQVLDSWIAIAFPWTLVRLGGLGMDGAAGDDRSNLLMFLVITVGGAATAAVNYVRSRRYPELERPRPEEPLRFAMECSETLFLPAFGGAVLVALANIGIASELFWQTVFPICLSAASLIWAAVGLVEKLPVKGLLPVIVFTSLGGLFVLPDTWSRASPSVWRQTRAFNRYVLLAASGSLSACAANGSGFGPSVFAGFFLVSAQLAFSFLAYRRLLRQPHAAADALRP